MNCCVRPLALAAIALKPTASNQTPQAGIRLDWIRPLLKARKPISRFVTTVQKGLEAKMTFVHKYSHLGQMIDYTLYYIYNI